MKLFLCSLLSSFLFFSSVLGQDVEEDKVTCTMLTKGYVRTFQGHNLRRRVSTCRDTTVAADCFDKENFAVTLPLDKKSVIVTIRKNEKVILDSQEITEGDVHVRFNEGVIQVTVPERAVTKLCGFCDYADARRDDIDECKLVSNDLIHEKTTVAQDIAV